MAKDAGSYERMAGSRGRQWTKIARFISLMQLVLIMSTPIWPSSRVSLIAQLIRISRSLLGNGSRQLDASLASSSKDHLSSVGFEQTVWRDIADDLGRPTKSLKSAQLPITLKERSQVTQAKFRPEWVQAEARRINGDAGDT